MVSATIIPNGDIVLVPLEADLQIMVLRDVTEQIFEKVVRFIFGQFHNALSESIMRIITLRILPFVDEESFPSGYWIGTNDRMNGLQFRTFVVRGASISCAERFPIAFSDDFEI